MMEASQETPAEPGADEEAEQEEGEKYEGGPIPPAAPSEESEA